MSWTIRAARPGDHEAILSLVDTAFSYGRFGFEPSGPLGISYPPVSGAW
jgi:hypothetical protein